MDLARVTGSCFPSRTQTAPSRQETPLSFASLGHLVRVVRSMIKQEKRRFKHWQHAQLCTYRDTEKPELPGLQHNC